MGGSADLASFQGAFHKFHFELVFGFRWGYQWAAMRLHNAKVPELARQIVDALLADRDIETESPGEVRADVQSVLEQYIRDEQQVLDRAKEVLQARGLPPSELPRLRRMVSQERGIKLGDEAIDYVLDQLVEMLMHSQNVDEIYADDVTLRRKMRDPLRKHAQIDDDVQAEVRSHLKHVKEGTALWEVEYQRMLEDIRRRKGL